MSDRIEEEASRGTSQLFQAIKDLLGRLAALETRLTEVERRVADMQNGHAEPRFRLQPSQVAMGYGEICTEDTAPISS